MEQEWPRPLSRTEAETLRASRPQISPWRVVALQAVVGVALAALAYGVWRDGSIALSVLYGAAVAVLPGALLARGLTGPLAVAHAATGVVSFMLWEGAKIVLALALLALAPKLVPGLSWPALLVALVVCSKAVYAAVWLQARPAHASSKPR